MAQYHIVRIREHQELIKQAATWFCNKWNVPQQAYLESMEESLNQYVRVPQWYVAIENKNIIAGLGVIENDFHDRIDLAPNVCALYVEEQYRCQGIAGKLLNDVCDDMKKQGIDTLYLITDHSSFYERYGWVFLCMVQGDGESGLARMYMRRTL